MTRWSAPLGLGLLVLVCGALALREKDAAASRAHVDLPSDAASSTTKQSPPLAAQALALPSPESTTLAPTILRRAPTFDLLEDGSMVPALDTAAPRRVKLGVALFRYRGAEGAGAQSRSREDALAIASAALAQGGTDFGQVVALGDPGSAVDVGWVGRGVLERGVEYPIFTAKVGETLPRPLDTPRGFWVVRRHK